MTEAPPETGVSNRRISGVEADLRRVASLHGVYAAALVLVGLFLPLVRLEFNIDVTFDYATWDLVTFTSTNEVDRPVVLVIVSMLLVVTALAAGGAFLVTAARQNRVAATVALLASLILILVVFIANFVLSHIDVLVSSSETSGDNFEAFQVWGVGAWVLLLGGFAGSWIGYVLRNQLEL